MPHQCLQCGQAFEQGSADLLKGCPGCGGTRFFYSAKPVPESEREALKEQQSADVKSVIMQLLSENPDASPADVLKSRSWDEWVQLKEDAPPAEGAAPPAPAPEESAAPSEDEAADAAKLANAVREAAERASAPRGARERPGTVHVSAPGEYELDVEALMARDPIVIEKDGTFMIHLPSAFDGDKKSKRRARS